MARKLCIVCGTRQARTIDGTTDLCRPCYEYAGWENTHSDYGHDDPDCVAKGYDTEASIAACLVCQDKDPTEQAPTTRNQPATRAARRTQLNHKRDCKHAQTPEARRACRTAYWAAQS